MRVLYVNDFVLAGRGWLPWRVHLCVEVVCPLLIALLKVAPAVLQAYPGRLFGLVVSLASSGLTLVKLLLLGLFLDFLGNLGLILETLELLHDLMQLELLPAFAERERWRR